MSSKYPNKADVNVENTVEMIRSDYTEPWIGVIRETIQNSVDGYGVNLDNGVIPKSRDLVVRFEVDTSDDSLLITDNAGGMSRTVMEENLVAIDNPSEEKSKGEGAGSYGRGFWVIVSCGEWTEVEVQHEGSTYATEVSRGGTYDDIKNIGRRKQGFDGSGTTYRIHDVIEGDMEKLSDPDAVRNALIRNFTPLLLDDSIHIEYVINGDKIEISPPNIYEMENENLLREEEEVREFEYRGETHALENLKLIESTDMDDVPWTGVMLYKGNKYLDYPFMKVDNYKPHGLPSMRSPPKMFGWCDASDVCRDRDDEVGTLESNSHNEIQLQNLGDKTGLRSLIDEVHDNHFKTEYSTKEKREMLENVQQDVNNILSDVESIEDMGQETDEGPEGEGETETNSVTLPFLKCITSGQVVDAGEDVNLIVQINPEDNLAYDAYDLYDIKVKRVDQDDETIAAQMPSLEIDLQENTPVERNLGTVSFDEEGKYRFSAKIRGKPNRIVQSLPDPTDTAGRTFYVGERPEPDTSTPSESEKEEGETNVEFVKDIEYYNSARGDRKAYASKDEDGGIRVHLNLAWPEVERIEEEYSGDAFEEKQRELFVRWSLESVRNMWMRDKLAEQEADDKIIDLYEKSISIGNEMDKNRVISDD